MTACCATLVLIATSAICAPAHASTTTSQCGALLDAIKQHPAGSGKARDDLIKQYLARGCTVDFGDPACRPRTVFTPGGDEVTVPCTNPPDHFAVALDPPPTPSTYSGDPAYPYVRLGFPFDIKVRAVDVFGYPANYTGQVTLSATGSGQRFSNFGVTTSPIPWSPSCLQTPTTSFDILPYELGSHTTPGTIAESCGYTDVNVTATGDGGLTGSSGSVQMGERYCDGLDNDGNGYVDDTYPLVNQQIPHASEFYRCSPSKTAYTSSNGSSSLTCLAGWANANGAVEDGCEQRLTPSTGATADLEATSITPSSPDFQGATLVPKNTTLLTLNLTVTNNGPTWSFMRFSNTWATNPGILAPSFPSGFNGAECSYPSAGELDCAADGNNPLDNALASGETRSIRLYVRFKCPNTLPSTLVDTFQVIGDTTDPNSANDTKSVSIPLRGC
jgi:hypothetical protein